MRIFVVLAAALCASPAMAFLCQGETVTCFDHNLGRHVTTRDADECGSYFDHEAGRHKYFAYCSEHPCGGQVARCWDETNHRFFSTLNADSCGSYFDHGSHQFVYYGYCDAN